MCFRVTSQSCYTTPEKYISKTQKYFVWECNTHWITVQSVHTLLALTTLSTVRYFTKVILGKTHQLAGMFLEDVSTMPI